MKSATNKKTCTLINARFSWILEVDGQSINFQQRSNADYFAAHYGKLGYIIKWEHV